MSENTQRKTTEPIHFVGIELYNPTAKLLAEVAMKQHEAGELSAEAFWKAAEVITANENFGRLGYAVNQIMRPENFGRILARLTGGPVEQAKSTPQRGLSL